MIEACLDVWGTRRFLATLQSHPLVVHFIGCFWQKNILAAESQGCRFLGALIATSDPH